MTSTQPVVAEGGAYSWTVSIASGVPAGSISVPIVLSGTAVDGIDYSRVPGTSPLSVTFSATDTAAKTIVVSAAADALAEADETITATLSSGAGYVLEPTTTTTTVTLTSRPSLSVAPVDSAEEGLSAKFRLSLTEPSATAVVVTLAWSSSSAILGTDYLDPGATATIPAGITTLDLPILTIDDLLAESTETITVTVSGAPSSILVVTSAATVQITDNEPSLSIAAATSAQEPAEAGSFTISYPGPVQSRAISGSLTWAGSASGGSDYLVPGTTFTIPSGQRSVSLTINPVDDLVYEGDESITATLVPGAYAITTASATLTLRDNESTVSVAATLTGSEPGTNGAFTFSYPLPALANPVVVRFSLGGSAVVGTDYLNPGTTITIPAGATSQDLPLQVVDDVLAEGVETVVVTLASDPGYRLGSTTQATLQLLDDEPTVSIAATTNGGEPGTAAAFTISYPGAALNRAVTINLTWDGSAAIGADVANPGTSVTIPANQTSSLLPLSIIDDTVAEGPETFTGTVLANSGYYVGTSAATVVIEDDEPTVTISAVAAGAEGGGPAKVRLQVDHPINRPLNIALTYAGSGRADQDFTPVYSATLPANATAIEVDVAILQDALVEGAETIVVSLTANPYDYVVGTANAATMMVTDDEPEVGLTVLTQPSEWGSPGTIRCALLGTALAAELPVTLSIGGTATSQADYTSLTTTVTIPAGATTADVVITPLDDGVTDPGETVILSVVGTSFYGVTPGKASATWTIADALPEISIGTVTAAAEPSTSGSVVIGYAGSALPGSNGAGRTVVVSIAIAGTAIPGVDVGVLPSTVVIPAGATSTMLVIQPIDDGVIDPGETVLVSLSAGTNYAVGSSSQGAVVIRDNDPTPVAIINDLDEVVIQQAVPWSHRLLVRTNELAGAVGIVATIAPAAGSGAPPPWLTVGTPVSTGEGTVAIPLGGTPTASGTVRFRVNVATVGGTAVVDITLVILGADGNA